MLWTITETYVLNNTNLTHSPINEDACLYLSPDNLNKSASFSTTVYSVPDEETTVVMFTCLSEHRMKFYCNRWSNKKLIYWTLLKYKVHALKFDCANVLALPYALKYVCTKCSRFTIVQLCLTSCFHYLRLVNVKFFHDTAAFINCYI